jgi:carbon-monoxide dehydrogenase medium subunit
MSGAPAVFFPRTVTEAVELLDAYAGAAKLVAGGTALTLMLQQRLVSPEALVSLRDVAGLSGTLVEDGVVRLGALVTHAEAARHPLVRTHLPVAATAFSLVGNAQVRTAATVGGVLAEADYASDPPAALLALDAEVVAVGPAGERRVPITEFLVGFYQTALAPDEVVTRVDVPALPPTAGSTYLKYTSRSHEDRPCVGVAAVVRADGDGTCRDVRVAVGAACDRPLRLADVEAGAVGAPLDDPAIEAVAMAYAERVDPVADVRGSAWYRREMVQVWVRRAVRAAREVAESNTNDQGQGAVQ